jgi:hypothetical protein
MSEPLSSGREFFAPGALTGIRLDDADNHFPEAVMVAQSRSCHVRETGTRCAPAGSAIFPCGLVEMAGQPSPRPATRNRFREHLQTLDRWPNTAHYSDCFRSRLS